MSLNFRKDFVLAVIPARGGSKSIPLKNMTMLGGRPLLSYVIGTAKKSSGLNEVVCSTDNETIARFCREQDIQVILRPDNLSGDDTPIADVMVHILETWHKMYDFIPGIVPLLQPTSPFILAGQLDELIRIMKQYPEADSAQTIATLPHNHHAFNQRIVEGKRVKFRFPEERLKCFNKQLKPKHHIFGNLLVTRAKSLLDGKGPFGEYSLYHKIESGYAVDIDGPNDLDYAEYLLRSGKVLLD
jgi:CMP-N-acetylneuraminic acid synthetase